MTIAVDTPNASIPSAVSKALRNLTNEFASAGHINREHLMGVHVGEEQFTVAPSRLFGKRKSVDQNFERTHRI